MEYLLVLFLIFNEIYSIMWSFNTGVLRYICSFCSKLSINIVGGYIGYLILGYYLSTYDLSSTIRKVCYLMGGFSFVLCVVFTVFYSRYNGETV